MNNEYGVGAGTARAAVTLAALLALGAVTTPSAQAQTFTDLYNFTGGSDGRNPYAGLVRDSAGNLYGTTFYGGSGYGVVFKVDTSGQETALYSFAGGTTDGCYPSSDLLRDKSGNLYGTTQSCGSSGYGVVFKVDTTGKEKVLHSFAGGTTDGCGPFGGLVADKLENVYGTTNACGAGGQGGYGTVFKLTKEGRESLLYSFQGTPDGANPTYGDLLIDKIGNLYGVTYLGGNAGQGTVFKLSNAGTETVLYSFQGGGSDGCGPMGTVTGKSGNLYGTTTSCGSGGLFLGIVWKLSKQGEEVLHTFTGSASDEGNPHAGVILDADGNLYGDSEEGGAHGQGTVYELSQGGTITLLHSFAGRPTDGSAPFGGLLRDQSGNLYGTTQTGGSDNYGTVWSLTP